MLKSLKSFCFGLKMVEGHDKNGINPFCDDRHFTTAAHFRFQGETLKINFMGVLMIFF